MTDPLKATPPAIVRADSAEMDQLAFEITSALEAGAKAARTTLERYREAGDALLKAKEKCGHTNWYPWLKKHGISQSTANRAMRIAAAWSQISHVTDLTQALRLLTDREDSEKTETANGQEVTSTGTETPDPYTAAPAAPSSPAPSIFCRDCRIHSPKKNCKACKELRKPERQAGDDTESEAAAKRRDRQARSTNGRPVWEWKSFDQPFGQVVRAIDLFGNAYKVKEDTRVEAVRDKLKDALREFKAVVKEVSKEAAT